MRKMKKTAALLMAAAMAASLTACGGGSGTTAAPTQAPAADGQAAEEGAEKADVDTSSFEGLDDVELIGADNTSKGAAGQLFGELVAAKVDEITGGKLTIDYHPNSELGDDGDILRQMQSNDIQIVVCQTAPLVSFVPEAAVFDLPMVFSKYDGDTIDKVLNAEDSAFRTQLSEAHETAGLHYLGILQNATYRLTTANKDLNTLADFKALQIRTMNNSNHMAFWTAIGAEPTPLAWSEVYFALQSGTIDAQENAADTAVGANLNEVQKVLACTNHILYANQMTINKEAYDSLDPAYQAALNQAVTEALAELRPQLTDIDEQNKKTLVDKGMTLVEYDNAFYDEILALDSVKKLYSDIDTQIGGLGTTLQDSLESTAQ